MRYCIVLLVVQIVPLQHLGDYQQASSPPLFSLISPAIGTTEYGCQLLIVVSVAIRYTSTENYLR